MTETRDISDGICAYLQGGLGNQLFIVAAALEQATRLDCPLYIDQSRYLARDPLSRGQEKETARVYELEPLEIDGALLSVNSPWYRNSPRRPTAIRSNRASRKLTVYRQPSLNFHPEINDIRPGTTLFGYFQSWRYFEKVADRFADALLGSQLQPADRDSISTLTQSASITAHVRRGDYLTAHAAEHHGIASADYFERAIQLIRSLTQQTVKVQVFSDSPDIAKAELRNIPNLEFMDKTGQLSGLATILAMQHGAGFAMSNSSFSWWAAWLMSRRNPDSPIVAPRPWLADGHSGHDQLLPNWITLDARQ